jgi:hypothetical protein
MRLYLVNAGQVPIQVSGAGDSDDLAIARHLAFGNLVMNSQAHLDPIRNPNPSIVMEDGIPTQLDDVIFSVIPDPANYDGGNFDVLTTGPDQHGSYHVIVTLSIAPNSHGKTIVEADFIYTDE